jgi:hypothetical protein
MGVGPSAITAWRLFLSVPMEGIQTRSEECATQALPIHVMQSLPMPVPHGRTGGSLSLMLRFEKGGA